MNRMGKYSRLKIEMLRCAERLIYERPDQEEIIYKVLDLMQKEIETGGKSPPHSFDAQGWKEDSIYFGNIVFMISVEKNGDKYLVKSGSHPFRDDVELRLPFKNLEETRHDWPDAVSTAIALFRDMEKKYFGYAVR